MGLDNASGEYIVFVDSDDWVELDMCEKLYHNAVSNDSDLVLFDSMECRLNNVNRLRKYFNNSICDDSNDFTFDYRFNKDLVLNWFLVVWSKLYKRSFLEENFLRFLDFEIFNDIRFHVLSILFAKKYLTHLMFYIIIDL